MEQPPGLQSPQAPNMVYKLHKALCGFKQAPRAWFEKLHAALLSFGFVSTKLDQSLFTWITPQHILYILVYVYDILITGDNDHIITGLIKD